MLCSTIIPTIGRDTLRRTVISALAQGLDESAHEIIVVNDSGVPLENDQYLTHPQVRLVTVNRVGEGAACNTGAALAKGRYLNFIHDDDYLLPDGLSALLTVALNTGCAWAFGAYKVVTSEGELLDTANASFPQNPFGILLTGECVHIGASLLRRDVFWRVGGFDPLLRDLLDRDLQVRIAADGQFAAINHEVACIRASHAEGSAYRNADVGSASRIIREKALNGEGATRKAIASAGNDPFLRGRVARNYGASAVLNLLAGRTAVSASRLAGCVRVASYFWILPSFWRGASYRMKFNEAGKRVETNVR